MAPHKHSLHGLLDRVKKPFNKHARFRDQKDKQSVAIEDDVAGTSLDRGERIPVDRLSLSNRDQRSSVLDPDTNFGLDSTTTQHNVVVDVDDKDRRSIIQEPFGWLLKHDIPSQTDRLNGSAVAPDITKDPRRATKRLRHNQYTVGWICALPKEMTAAKAMLDEVHMPLPNSQGDYNTYQLGSIGDHNVVIASLRYGVYGTTSATAIAVAMRSTYSNSNIMPLMVGIGGGVPSLYDIRLGDVVISVPSPGHPAVVQYDYGKSAIHGDIETRGMLDKPTPALLSALSNFQSELALRPSEASKYMDLAINQFSLDRLGFSYPGSEHDVLFEPECEHSHEDLECARCPARPRARKPRQNLSPVIHYGTIGSGNQVIKHARTRDRIAARHDILCFEMEAAGVMDHFPCLVIRGICDYCDTHKSKEWQEYASLAAAAVAKEFLSRTPFSLVELADDEAGTNSKVKRRQRLLDSLDFEDRYTRRDTVKRAHPQTCKWLLRQRQFLDWTDPDSYESHRGLVWMKGKPGAGKSTIMKWLMDYTEQLCKNSKTAMVISFFFNARGSELTRSTIGMYRSLVVQVFEQMPVLESLLDQVRSHVSETSFETHKWTLEALEDILCDIVKFLGSMHLICYIDALDECPEDQIREMISFFDRLTKLADANHLYVCFSSRHYPHISMKNGLDFILENEEGHSEDIINYLDGELVLGRDKLASELKEKMYAKSGGIFLWIVLVVQILNREYDRGGVHKLLRLLDETPAQVDELFRDILTRDTVNLPQLVTSIRWVLYSQRPLRLEEFYHAIHASEPSSTLEFLRSGIKVTRDDMQRYLLSCSKGMMEITASVTVQFIHETVREFLLQPGVLVGLWPGFEGILEGTSQELLKQYCHEYWKIAIKSYTPNASRTFPFLSYATDYVLAHAEQAERFDIPQGNFLEAFDYRSWTQEHIVATDSCTPQLPMPPSQVEKSSYNTSSGVLLLKDFNTLDYSYKFGVCLAKRKLPKLLARWIEATRMQSDWTEVSARLVASLINVDDLPMLKTVILADHSGGASAESISYIFDSLIYTPSSNQVNRVDIDAPQTLETMNFEDHSYDTEFEIEKVTSIVNALRSGNRALLKDLNLALHIAASKLILVAIEFFVHSGAEINSYGPGRLMVIQEVLAYSERKTLGDMIDCIKLLIKNGADINAHDERKSSPLSNAIHRQLYVIVDLLLDHGAYVLTNDLSLCLGWIGKPIGRDLRKEILSYHQAGKTFAAVTMLKKYMNEEQVSAAERLLQAHAKVTLKAEGSF